MGYIVRIPKLGMEMREGTVVEWKVEEGEQVEADETIVVIESEKSTADVDARESGSLRRQILEVGDSGEPGTPIGIVAEPDEDISSLEAQLEDGTGEPNKQPSTSETDTKPSEPTSANADMKVKAAPRARKRAEELGVDLTTVSGSGPGGAITENDVEAAADAAEESSHRTVIEERTLSPTRRTIAERLGTSYREAIHVTEHRTADAEALITAAEAADEALDVTVSVQDILLLAVSASLKEHPEFNATFKNDVHRLYQEHNIGIAVDTEDGLIVPVIRDVGLMTLPELSQTRQSLTQQVLDGEYEMDDLQGGTFTVTNLGVFGIERFNPIINPPEIAILGVNAITEQPVKDDGDVSWRRSIPLSLSFDHRVVDGADAARFLDTLVSHLEAPAALLPDEVSIEPSVSDDTNDVVVPKRQVTSDLYDDLSGRVTAGSIEWDFDVTEEFGGGDAPTPVDLFLGSLSACLAASIGIQAEIRGIDIDRLSVNIRGEPVEGSVEKIEVDIVLRSEADDETLNRIVEGGERTCHVKELLQKDFPVDLHWRRD